MRAYKQRIQEVKQGTFTPLVMFLSGSCGNAANIWLPSMLSEKWDHTYSNTLG